MSTPALLLGTALWLLPTPARHPMHTAVTEIVYQAISASATIRVRVFLDDLTTAVGRPPGTPVGDSAMARYVTAGLTVTDGTGRRLPLRWEGSEQTGDVMLLRLTAAAPAGLDGGSVGSRLLTERFEDQVNIVRVSWSGRTRTLLFTRGEAAKPLD
ncbi:MAG TPA: DUF6702 family protein [Gemmatimonadales bacterium]|jgi:hypothetical protein|nr:DUF6702 family protein [Gemmatimonadales bacterium]